MSSNPKDPQTDAPKAFNNQQKLAIGLGLTNAALFVGAVMHELPIEKIYAIDRVKERAETDIANAASILEQRLENFPSDNAEPKAPLLSSVSNTTRSAAERAPIMVEAPPGEINSIGIITIDNNVPGLVVTKSAMTEPLIVSAPNRHSTKPVQLIFEERPTQHNLQVAKGEEGQLVFTLLDGGSITINGSADVQLMAKDEKGNMQAALFSPYQSQDELTGLMMCMYNALSPKETQACTIAPIEERYDVQLAELNNTPATPIATMPFAKREEIRRSQQDNLPQRTR